MALYEIASGEELAALRGMPSSGQTRLFNALGRNTGASDDNFFEKRRKSIDNAIGTTGAALATTGGNLLGAGIAGLSGDGHYYSFVDSKHNDEMQKLLKQGDVSRHNIFTSNGFEGQDAYYDAKEKAEKDAFSKIGFDIDDYWNKRADADIAGDKSTVDSLDATYNAAKAQLTGDDAATIAKFDAVQDQLKNMANRNRDAVSEKRAEYNDYVKNNPISQRINQDQGKFAGSAINTLSTAFDVMAPGAGVLANSVQGGIEGIADELEQNGLQNFDLGRAGQNALIGATTGAVTGGLNKGISNQLAKNGGNLFRGGNAITRGLNNLGSSTTAGRIGSTLATGAARGAVSGAVGGATGAGLSAAMNGQDVLGSAIEGAQRGFGQGALAGGIMAGANMAANATPGVGNVMRQLNEAGDNWKNSGDTFNERLTNTLTSGDSPVGEWLQGNTRSRALQRAGMIGNTIQDVSKTLNSLNPTGTVNTEYDPTFRATAPLGNDMTTYAKTAGISPDQEVTVYRGVPANASDAINPGDYITTNRQLAQDYAGNGKVIEQRVPASSILDSVSEPLGEEYIYRPGQQLMYHTTNPNIPFNEAGPDNGMIWVTPDKKYSTAFAQNGDQTYDVYADIKNPASIGNIDGSINPGSIRALSDATGISEPDLMNIAKKQDTVHLFGITNSRDFRDMLKNRGFDGVEALEAGGRVKTYAAFDPNQIRSANGSPNISSTTPKTVGEWLKQAGKRVVEDANNRGVGMSIKDVAEPETQVYRMLTNQTDTPQTETSGWDNIAKEYGYNNYDDAVADFSKANPGTKVDAGKVMDWLDSGQKTNTKIMGVDEAKQRLKNLKADTLETRAAEDLLNQVGTATAPAAKADNMIENVKKFMGEGLTKPEEWKLASDAVTGNNGVMTKLYRNLIDQAGDVDTFSGLGGRYGSGIEDTIDYYIKANGLVGSDAEGIRNEIMAVVNGLPSRLEGSVSMTDNANDVMKAVRELESHRRHYMGQDSRNNSNPTPFKDQKARVINQITNILENRIYDKVPDASKVVTPEAIAELKSFFPNNEKWARSVDEKFANIKTGKDLRAAQKPYVQTADYLKNVKSNFGTYGQRVGDFYGNALSQAVRKVPVVGGILAQATNTPFMNRRYADINSARADRLRGDMIDLPSSSKIKTSGNGGDMGGNNNIIAIEPTSNNNGGGNIIDTTYNPSTRMYEAIGRTEGLTNAEQARTANYLTNAVQEYNAGGQPGNTLESLAMPVNNTSGTSVYNSMYGTPTTGSRITSPSGNSYFQATGDYWTDVIARAMTSAIEADDVDAFGSLYAMYQDAISKLDKSKGKDYSDITNWNSADRTKLLSAQNAMGQIDELENAYNDATGGSGGNILQGNLRSLAANISGGNLDPSANNYNKLAESVGMGIVKNLINLGVTEADAKRYLEYLPALTDTKEQAQQKLETLRSIYQNQIDNLYSAYGV